VTDVVLVDYGSGNLRSLRAAVERTGTRAVVTADPDVVAGARRIMVPGQGAAGPTMATLRQTGLEEAIRTAVAGGAHLLGVCVGLQLLFGSSEEDEAACLGFLDGRAERLRGTARLPHMGWNDVEPAASHPLAAALPACAYFAHSYAVPAETASVVATTEVDGVRFASVVASGRVAGMQFHPERSGGAGLALLTAFMAWADAA
jgi:glutamine amidotransferase